MEKKFLFIIKRDSKEFFYNMIESIKSLFIPEGYKIEIQRVTGDEICKNYNKIIKRYSNSKYKIYVKKNIEFINRNFLYDILLYFSADPAVGALGLVGASNISSDGKMVNCLKKYGAYFFKDEKNKILGYRYENPLFFQEVDCIDESIIVTQYDFLWDEEMGGMFCNIAQCQQLKKHGYKTIVPQQNNIWVLWEQAGSFAKLYNTSADIEQRNVFLEKYSSELFPLVSILIPAYNQPKYFEIALKSALNQEYKNIEIIIGDDSTNEDIKKLIQPYLKKDKRIKYYFHGGIPLGEKGRANAAFVLQKSSGEYINYLLQDDMFYPNKISTMMNYYLIDNTISMVTSVRNAIDENGKILGIVNSWMPYQTGILDSDKTARMILFNFNNFIGELSTVLIKKDLLSVGFNKFFIGIFSGFRDIAHGDVGTWLNLLEQGKCVFISEVLSAYRMQDEQNSNDINIIINSVLEWFNYLTISWLTDKYIYTYDEYKRACNSWIDFAKRVVLANDMISEKYTLQDNYICVKKINDCILSGKYKAALFTSMQYLNSYIPNKEDLYNLYKDNKKIVLMEVTYEI